jgi:hypothetical protein
MAETYSGRVRRKVSTIAGVVALVIAVPLTVIASHSFTDVTDSNEFHASIEWLKDNQVTIGCNPPANTLFCPDDAIPREQMASFMHRFAQTFGSTGANVTDPADTIDTTGVDFVGLSSVEVTPISEAGIVLNAHATLTKDALVEGTYQVIIARESCEGTALGSASWTGVAITGGTTDTDTLSLTASDVVSAATTYVVCAAESDDLDPAATATTRGLTASWAPTS